MSSIKKSVCIALSVLFACFALSARAMDEDSDKKAYSFKNWMAKLGGDPNKFTRGAGSTVWRSIKCGGLNRSYLLYTPVNSQASSKELPLVIACHGGGGTARRMDKLTGGISLLADRENFMVVYPQGLRRRWNDGRTVNLSTTSDVEFISCLIDELVKEGKVDPDRIYSTGISNGGFFSQYLAKKLPGKIAAVASVAATLPEAYTKYEATSPVPVLYMLGTEDPLVPFTGGVVGGKLLVQERGKVVPARQAVQYWLVNNGIESVRPRKSKLDTDASEGISILVRDYRNGDSKRDVLVYELVGGGHTWPGGWKYLPERLIGKTATSINANELIWEFFSGHSK